jgi:hypothetical protein
MTTKGFRPGTALGVGAPAVLLVAALGVGAFQLLADPGKGRLFGTDGDGERLLLVSPQNGRSLPVGTLGFPAPSLAFDAPPGDATLDNLYAGRGGGFPYLYRVDPDTAAASYLRTTAGYALEALDFHARDATTDAYSFPATAPDGSPAPATLYAALDLLGGAGSGADHLAILSPFFPATTVVGPFGHCAGSGCTIEGMEALAFDPSGQLWGAVSAHGTAGAPGLYRIDRETGDATFVAALDNVGDVGPAGPPTGGLASLHFTCDGTLVGGTAASLVGRRDGGRLVVIDPATGGFVYAGRSPAVEEGSLAGLAFQSPCFTLFAPTPGTSGTVNALLAVGATPGRTAWLFVARKVGTNPAMVPGCPALDLGLHDARARATVLTGVDGHSRFEIDVPAGASGQTLYFQAVDRGSCTVSNVGAFTFP